MRVLAVFAMLAMLAMSSVEARLHRPVSKAVPAAAAAAPYQFPPGHPELTATQATRDSWAQITKQLEARNYSRPNKQHLNDIGHQSTSLQLGGGTYGVDVSSWVGSNSWSCIKAKGYDVAIVRGYMEVCEVDSNGVHTVANAWAAGLAHVDIYLFPSYGCGKSAATQVDEAINYMGSIPFGTLWFDVETGGQGSAQNNMNWLRAGTAHAAQRLGSSRVGVYSSNYEWGQVMGGQTGPTQFPIWYANYDGSPSFNSWRSFGGWGHPAMHQFAGDSNVCGVDVDLNWY